MKNIVIYSIIFLSLIISSYQLLCINEEFINLQIFVDSFDGKDSYEFWINNRNIKGERITFTENNKYLSGTLIDSKGKLNFIMIDSIKHIIIKGQYVNGLDTLKKQVYQMDPIFLRDAIIVKKYFQPLQDGDWEYRDFNDSLISIRHYKNGILM